jgi:hypothetical protein
MRTSVAACVVGCAAIIGCGSAAETTGGAGGGGVGGSGSGAGTSVGFTTSSSTSTGSSGMPAATGLPCDVAMMLQAHCWSCHGSPPSGGAPTALVTYADLAAPAKSDPSKSMAQVAVARMLDTVSPMPPKPEPPVPTAERAPFMQWVNAGLPMGTCGSSSSSSSSSGATSTSSSSSSSSGGPYDTPLMCSSNTYWMGGDSGSGNMHPGKACRSCHAVGGKASGKTFDVAGTVYPSAHEPDDCNGVSVAGAQVVITDATGQDFTLDVNSVGNFEHQDFFGFLAFKLPIKAKVVYNGKERVMTAPQMSGDCNSCHTQDGTSNAPGRIMLP